MTDVPILSFSERIELLKERIEKIREIVIHSEKAKDKLDDFMDLYCAYTFCSWLVSGLTILVKTKPEDGLLSAYLLDNIIVELQEHLFEVEGVLKERGLLQSE